MYLEPETVVRRSKKETAETDGKRKTVLEQIVIAQSGNYSHFNQSDAQNIVDILSTYALS